MWGEKEKFQERPKPFCLEQLEGWLPLQKWLDCKRSRSGPGGEDQEFGFRHTVQYQHK